MDFAYEIIVKYQLACSLKLCFTWTIVAKQTKLRAVELTSTVPFLIKKLEWGRYRISTIEKDNKTSSLFITSQRGNSILWCLVIVFKYFSYNYLEQAGVKFNWHSPLSCFMFENLFAKKSNIYCIYFITSQQQVLYFLPKLSIYRQSDCVCVYFWVRGDLEVSVRMWMYFACDLHKTVIPLATRALNASIFRILRTLNAN